jgi:hypothetical protein
MQHAISLEKKIEVNYLIKVINEVLSKYSKENNNNFENAYLVLNIAKATTVEIK